jgi:hypothetical protein
LARAKQLDKDFSAPKTPLLLLEGDKEGDVLTMHPLTLDANSPNFLKPRHAPITTITLVGFRLADAETLSDVEWEIERLPVGFVRSAYRGLGLNYDLRLLVDTIVKLPGITDLRIEKRSAAAPTIQKGSLSLPYDLFETARKDIGRVHDKALAAARTEKASRLHDKLLNPLDPVLTPSLGSPITRTPSSGPLATVSSRASSSRPLTRPCWWKLRPAWSGKLREGNRLSC